MEAIEFCPKCGKELHGHNEYCPYCGEALSYKAKQEQDIKEQEKRNRQIFLAEGDEVKHPENFYLALAIVSIFTCVSLFVPALSLIFSMTQRNENKKTKVAFYISIISLALGVVTLITLLTLSGLGILKVQ